MNHIEFIKNLGSLGWHIEKPSSHLQEFQNNAHEVAEKICT